MGYVLQGAIFSIGAASDTLLKVAAFFGNDSQ